MLQENEILKVLSTVQEPDLKRDLVSLKMVRNIVINGRKLAFELVLTTPACPMKDKMESDCKMALQDAFGDDLEIEITFSSAPYGLRADTLEILPGIKNVLLVSSGKGGVGKSTVAANLALALSDLGASVGILDADIYGPSLPILFGLSGQRPLMEDHDGKQLIIPIEKYGIKTMSIGLLIDEAQSVVWRGPMISSALRQFITDVKWDNLDYLVVDMPPGTGDIHLSMAQLVKKSMAIIVTTPQKLALSDARKGAGMYQMAQIGVPILGVVENMSWFTPALHPQEKYFLFGDGGGQKLADEIGVDLIGQIPVVLQVSEGGDKGTPIYLELGENPIKEIFRNIASTIAQKISIERFQAELS